MWIRLKRLDKIIIFFVLAFFISLSLIQLFEKRFDETQWAADPLHRYKMIDNLIESQFIMDKTKQEVLQILGEPTSRSISQEEFFIYDIGDPPSFFDSRKEHLMIIFENEKVKEVTLAFDD